MSEKGKTPQAIPSPIGKAQTPSFRHLNTNYIKSRSPCKYQNLTRGHQEESIVHLTGFGAYSSTWLFWMDHMCQCGTIFSPPYILTLGWKYRTIISPRGENIATISSPPLRYASPQSRQYMTDISFMIAGALFQPMSSSMGVIISCHDISTPTL